jgi:hypothetical protein
MNKRIIYTGLNREGAECCCILIPTGELPIEAVARKDVPQGVAYKITDVSEIPDDRTFRNAWEAGSNNEPSVKINLNKAKEIAHEKRRAARAEDFAPLDIEATIPAKANQAEAAREAIRQKYAEMQAQMDAATTVDELKAILPSND